MPQPKRTREENVAKYGASNSKEGVGVNLVRDLVNADGRLVFVKSEESARADLCVHMPNAPDEAVGVQVKTCHTAEIADGTRRYHRFAATAGYDGLFLMLISFVLEAPLIWVIPGRLVETDTLHIPVAPRPRKIHHWDFPRWAVPVDSLAQRLVEAWASTREIVIQPASKLILPQSETRLKEYHALLSIRSRIPFEMVAPEFEHSAYGYIVDGWRWQLKLSHASPSGRVFTVSLAKNAGHVNRKPTTTQYQPGDFDFVCVQLPMEHKSLEGHPPRMWLIPMATLVARGSAGLAAKSGHICVHPVGAGAWDSEFMVDLSSHATFMQDYSRILSNSPAPHVDG